MFTLYERPNLEEYNKLIYLHPEIHSSQVLRLKNYIKTGFSTDERGIKYHSIKVEYKQKTYNNIGYGRFFPKDPSMMPAAYQPRKVRTSLFQNNEIDIDIVNAHPTIMASLYKNDVGKNAPVGFLNYIKKRDEIVSSMHINEEAINRYNEENFTDRTKKDLVKVLYTACLYGQSLEGWENAYNLTKDDYTLSDNFKSYSNAVKKMTKDILSLSKYDELKSNYAKEKQIGVEDIRDNKLMSLILQDWETKLVRRCMNIFKENGIIIRSYIYDGFQIEKTDKDIESIFKKVHTALNKEFKMKVEFIAKPFSESLDYTEDIIKQINERKAVVDLMDFFTEENCTRLLKQWLRGKYILNDKDLYEYNKGVWKSINSGLLKGKTRSDFIDYVGIKIDSYMNTNVPSPELRKLIEKTKKESLEKIHRAGFINNVFNNLSDDISREFKLDTKPYLLNGPNGTLNFKTMKIQPHDSDDFLSYSINCDLPNIDEIKKEDFKNILDLIEEWVPNMGEYLLSMLSMCLDGRPTMEKCLVLMGILSRNGKSTLVTLLKTCLGDYVGDLGFSWITEKSKDSNKPDPLIKNCIRKRMSFINEANDNCEINEEKFKKAIGKDDFTYRDLYQSSKSMETECFQSTLIFTTNSNLSFNNIDSAISNRLSFINFPNTFGDPSNKFWDEKNPNCKPLDIKLKTKIINGFYNDQLIKALLYYYVNPVTQPEFAKDYHKEIVSEMDSVSQWCNDYLVVDSSNFNYKTDSNIIETFGEHLLDKPRVITQDFLYKMYLKDCEGSPDLVKIRSFSSSIKQIYAELYGNTKTRLFGGQKNYYKNLRYAYFSEDMEVLNG